MSLSCYFAISDLTAEKLLAQEENQHKSHNRIIQDLTEIQEKAHDALKKLGKHYEMVQIYYARFLTVAISSQPLKAIANDLVDTCW